jgi:hypothetical protein
LDSFVEEGVLNLDGTNSFVELPPNIFKDLTNATVEAWVKWNRLDDYQSFFSYGGEQNDFTIRFHKDDAERNLTFGIAAPNWTTLTVGYLLQTNQWVHVAASAGEGGMRLCFNGVIVAITSLIPSRTFEGGAQLHRPDECWSRL